MASCVISDLEKQRISLIFSSYVHMLDQPTAFSPSSSSSSSLVTLPFAAHPLHNNLAWLPTLPHPATASDIIVRATGVLNA
jgi:hypothetical protein